MSDTEIPIAWPEPKPRSIGALILFLLFALPMPLCLIIYNFIVWSIGQGAVISSGLRAIDKVGLIGLAVQTLLAIGVTALLWRFTKDERFKPVYAGWLGAALIAIPALLLRLLGSHDDQIGSLVQIGLALAAMLMVRITRKNDIQWDFGYSGFGLIAAGVGVLPLAIYGAFGSFGDAFLSLLAGFSFGFLAVTLIEATTGNVFLDGLGISVTLALLASAFGYDGSQLILLAILPAFAFAIAAVMPSKGAAGAAIGLLAFAGLAFFDPTELTLLLGDLAAVAVKACWIVVLAGLVSGAAALILRAVTKPSSTSSLSEVEGQRTKRAIGWVGAAALWVFIIMVFFIAGHPGNYGDRLFIIFKDQADISSVAKIKNRNVRLINAYTRLKKQADETQVGLRIKLDRIHVEYTSYYLENAMEVRGGTLVRLYLMSRTDIDRILPSPRLRPVAPEASPSWAATTLSGETEWNITMIGADKVWTEFGARGLGIVVGQSDSGVDGNHPAIHDQYRGLLEGDDYNWFDPWDGTTSPNDGNGHGTHTMGTILGKDGIGVAPKAKWIGCVNLERNLANPALYLDCMQFMLAPFPHGGDPFKDGDPTKAAHVINNSWGCPGLEGCDPDTLKIATDHLRDAGIFVVASAGNDGPDCSTVKEPLALYDSAFSVGAMDQSGNMADFSSRGPVTADGSGRAKPDIAAPGVDILSSTPNGSYTSFSGTSMAGPHVVGAVALLWSVAPKLIGNIDATEQLLIETAQPYTGSRSIGCFSFSGDSQNNAYGYGVLDVYAAVKKVMGK